MIKHVKKCISKVLAFMLFFSSCYVGLNLSKDEAYAANLKPLTYSYAGAERTYQHYATGGNLDLYCDETTGNIAVKDKRNGYVWKSAVDDSVYNVGSLNKNFTPYVQSTMTMSYVATDARDNVAIKVYSYAASVTTEKINNGVAVTYAFNNKAGEYIGIKVTIEFVLDNGQFVARIPQEKLVEQEVAVISYKDQGLPTEQIIETFYIIESLEVLPFFGAANNEVDGYLFYPDGCGGLTLYSEVNNRPSNVVLATWKTYSNAIVELYSDTQYTAVLPTIGMKNNENAFIATLTKEIEQSAITAYPSGVANLKLNHINFDVIMRYRYEINLSSISVDGATQSKPVNRLQSDLINTDREIRYFMLQGDQADYTGMAQTYRQYLMENGLLQQVIKEGDTLPLSLPVFMGISESKMFYKSFIEMTSFENVITILTDLANAGITNVKTVLRGWIKGGYGTTPVNWPPDNAVGGKNGLKKLDEYLKTNTNVSLFLENDFIYADKENGTFSARKDIIYDGAGLPVSWDFGNGKHYLLSPVAVVQRNLNFLKNISSYSEVNVAYEWLGTKIYQDYSKYGASTRTETVQRWQEMMKATTDANREVAVEGANQYVFGYADYIYSLPTETFKRFITDKEVPFLQLVISGAIPYSSSVGNLSADIDEEILRWVEFGAIPSFEVTYNAPLALKTTNYNQLYTSKWDNWKDRVVTIYSEMKERLADVYSYQMLRHEEIQDGLIKLTYSNGSIVYVNYNDVSVKVGNVTIPATDYLVVKGGNQ